MTTAIRENVFHSRHRPSFYLSTLLSFCPMLRATKRLLDVLPGSTICFNATVGAWALLADSLAVETTSNGILSTILYSFSAEDAAFGTVAWTSSTATGYPVSVISRDASGVVVFNITFLSFEASFGADLTPPSFSGKCTPAPTVACPSVLSGSVGVAYTDKFVATGGYKIATATYDSMSELPPGLTLNNLTGVLSGTPTAGGNFSVSVMVRDAKQGVGISNNCYLVIAGGSTVSTISSPSSTASSLLTTTSGSWTTTPIQSTTLASSTTIRTSTTSRGTTTGPSATTTQSTSTAARTTTVASTLPPASSCSVVAALPSLICAGNGVVYNVSFFVESARLRL